MNKISHFLQSPSTIQKNLPFDLSSIDKKVFLITFVIIASLAYLTWAIYSSLSKTQPAKKLEVISKPSSKPSYRIIYVNNERNQKVQKFAIEQLQKKPHASPHLDRSDDLITFAKTHGSDIKNLDIKFPLYFTRDEFILLMQYCPNLESLSVLSMEVDDSCCSYIESLSKLQKLSLIDTRITNLKFLSNLKNLNNLTFLIYRGENTFEFLSSLTSLEFLKLDHVNLTEKSFQHIAMVTNLKSVSLKGSDFSEEHLSHLNGLIHLKHLDISDTSITDAGLSILSKLSSLETLKIDHCPKITNEGLAHLKNMVNLKRLDCQQNEQITSKGLTHLASHPALQNVDLTRCYFIDSDIITAGITCRYQI